MIPVQALYRWADRREMVSIDPTVNLELPETGGRREWSCTPAQGKALLDALPDEVCPVFTTALYAGLRRGELRALRVSNLRVLNGVGAIDVQHGWDDYEGERDTKSRASVREVPMPAACGRSSTLTWSGSASRGRAPVPERPAPPRADARKRPVHVELRPGPRR